MKNQQKRWVAYVSLPHRNYDPELVPRFLETLEDYTPWVEYRGRYKAYLELGGVRRLWGHPFRVIACIQEELSRSGIPAAFGLGSNKLLARSAAALAGEGEVLWILPRGERDFLKGLAVELWPELSRSTVAQLRLLGIRRVGDLSLVDPFWVRRVWGEYGLLLWQQARGLDPRPVVRRLPFSVASFLPEEPSLFLPREKEEKLGILKQLVDFLRRKYGRKVISLGKPLLENRKQLSENGNR